MKTLHCCVVSLAVASLGAQEASPVAKLIDAVAPSIVTVRVVAELSMPMMGGETHEMKQETLGIVVDKSGLVLVSTGAVDPAAQMSMMFGGEAEMESTVTSLKVMIGDEAKELTGTVVAKDDKLGFTFVKIADLGDRQLAPLAFEQKGEPALGASVWSVQRLSEGYDFAPVANRTEIVGRIKKPRSAWVLADNVGVGSPVFNADGGLCGVVAQIQAPGDGAGNQGMMMMMMGGGHRGPATFLVSAQAAATSIAQAVEAAAKAPAKAEGAKDGEKKEGEPKKDEPKKDG